MDDTIKDIEDYLKKQRQPTSPKWDDEAIKRAQENYKRGLKRRE